MLDAIVEGTKHVTNDTASIKRFVGAYAYLVSNRAAQILSQMGPIKYQLDHQISIQLAANKIKAYAYLGQPIIVHDMRFGTSIQDLSCSNCKTKDLSKETEPGSIHNSTNLHKHILWIVLLCLIVFVIIFIVFICLW
jgi:hypothetical protein